jgi:anti-anti-sigma factor
VAVDDVDGVPVLSLQGELDIASSSDLPTRLVGLAQASPPRLVVDLADLSFIDSSGVNALVETARAVQLDGGSIAFAAATPQVGRVLELVRLQDVVPLEPTVPSALARVRSGRE